MLCLLYHRGGGAELSYLMYGSNIKMPYYIISEWLLYETPLSVICNHIAHCVPYNSIDCSSRCAWRAVIQMWPRWVFWLRMAYKTTTKVLARGGVTLGSIGEETAPNLFTWFVGRSWLGCYLQLARSYPHLVPCRPDHHLITPIIRVSKAGNNNLGCSSERISLHKSGWPARVQKSGGEGSLRYFLTIVTEFFGNGTRQWTQTMFHWPQCQWQLIDIWSVNSGSVPQMSEWKHLQCSTLTPHKLPQPFKWALKCGECSR